MKAYAAITSLVFDNMAIPPAQVHVHTPEELVSAIYAITLQPLDRHRIKIDFYRPPMDCPCAPAETTPLGDPPIFSALTDEMRARIAAHEEMEKPLEPAHPEFCVCGHPGCGTVTLDELEAEELRATYDPEPADQLDRIGPDPASIVQCGRVGQVYWKDGEPPKDTGTCHLAPGHEGPCAWEADRIPDARGPEAPRGLWPMNAHHAWDRPVDRIADVVNAGLVGPPEGYRLVEPAPIQDPALMAVEPAGTPAATSDQG